MNISAPFIRRPVATTLLTVAVALAGAVAYEVLPVAPLPEVDFPTISVSSGLPGASADIMASSVATPLERQFGHIAGVTEMTSASTLGSTSVTIQFDLSRDIDGAARDVEAAINAARTYLPANLPGNPTYRKVNPADSPIMILGLTSDKYGPDKIYDEASTVLAQKLSQIQGVGQVSVGGGALPSVRVDANPTQLASYGLTLSNLQSVLSLQNSDLAKGQITDGVVTADILANDQISHAEDYKPLVVGYSNGAAVHLSDVAQVTDSVQNVRAAGYLNGKRSVTVIIFRQPGANIINTVDRITAQLPSIQASIPFGIETTIVLDRTTTIRASVSDVERTLLISIGLVILVVFVFLRNGRATLIPAVAVPVSLVGTFAVMYMLGYTLDNLSLMAMTIATGFVVDDAIVVMENISRHLENGVKPFAAALKGAEEIGFTVFTISISLIAVFIPLLLMGGIVGRLFREFAVTLSTAVFVSMIISLTTTPMMCAYLLKDERTEKHGRMYMASEKFFDWVLSLYRGSLHWVLDTSHSHPRRTLRHYRAQCSGGLRDTQRAFPGRGHRSDPGQRSWAAGFIVPGDGQLHPADRCGNQERSCRRQCDCVYRRGRGHKWRLALRCAQAPGGTQGECLSNHQPPASPAEPSAGSFGVPAGRSRSAHRRPVQQCDVPVHDPIRQCAGSFQVGADHTGSDAAPAGPAGRKLRPAEWRPG